MEANEIIKKIEIKDLFQNKNYLRLLTANMISRFGDSVDGIAYAWMVYLMTGSKLLLGSLFAVNAIPNILLGPFSGVLADRYDKKKLILFGYIGRGLVVSLTAALFALGLLRPWHLFALTLVNSTLETLTMPATMSLLAIILTPEEFLSANAFSSSAYRFAELIGTAIAGILIALVGIAGAIWVDAATFFIAAAILFFITAEHMSVTVQELGIKGYLTDLKMAFRFIGKHPLIKLSLLLFAVINFCLAPMNVLMPVFVKDVLAGGPELLSAIFMAFLVGMIGGGLGVSQYGNRFKTQQMIIGGMGCFGLFYALLFLPGYIFPIGIYSNITTLSSFFFMGVLIPVASTPIQVYIMRNTDPSMMGRVGAFMSMISCVAIPIGAALTGVVSELIPISILFLLMGGIIMVAVASLLFNKHFADMK